MNILPLSLTAANVDAEFEVLDSLESLDVENLHEVILTSHINASKARPSLYTEEKMEMVGPSDYHFDFLNSKRPEIARLSSNEELKGVADQLSVRLKERIEQSVHARTFKVLKKTFPDLSELRQSNMNPDGLTLEEEAKLTTCIERFQDGYQTILDEVKECDDKFWETVLPTEEDCIGIKEFWVKMVPEYKGDEAEFRKKIQQALFKVSDLFHKNKMDNKAQLALQLNKKLVDHFFAMKQQRKEKFQELCEQWEKSTNDKILLDKFIQLETESVEALFEELRNQHHLHSLSRFQNLMSCHSQFVNGMNYLFQAIERRGDRAEAIKNIVSEMLLNASKDPAKQKNESTATAYYRDVQGAAIDKTLSKADESFNTKMALVFKKAIRNYQFIRRADAHTMPFPAAFSWNMDKLEQKFKSHSFTLDPSLAKKRVSKEAFRESDKKLIVQEAIDRLGLDMQSDMGQFVWESMSLIVGLALREASETQLFPVFINSSLDGLSETKLADKEFLKSISSSTKLPESDYKVILGQNLNQLLDLEKEVDEVEVFNANKGYMSQILNCLKYRINQVSKQPVDMITLDELYEMRLICDIWSVLEQVEKQYGQTIDPSIQLDWKQLQQWSEITA